jgi:hypothetical protein
MTDNVAHEDFGRTFEFTRPPGSSDGPIVPLIETEPSEQESTWSILMQLRNPLTFADKITVTLEWWVGQALFTKTRVLNAHTSLIAIRTSVSGRKIRLSAVYHAGGGVGPFPPATLLAVGASPDAPMLGQQFFWPHWVNGGAVTGPSQIATDGPVGAAGVLTDAVIDIVAVPGAGPFFILFVDKSIAVPPVNGDVPIPGGTSRAFTAVPDNVTFEGFGDDYLEFSTGLWAVASTTPQSVTLAAGVTFYLQRRVGG